MFDQHISQKLIAVIPQFQLEVCADPFFDEPNRVNYPTKAVSYIIAPSWHPPL